MLVLFVLTLIPMTDPAKKNNKEYKLKPPNMHQQNAAKQAIRAYKNHCMAGFASCDPNSPLLEWERLLTQWEITFNLLQTSRVNPILSAHTYLFGNLILIKHL